MSQLVRLFRVTLVGAGLLLFATAMSGPGVQALAPDVPVRASQPAAQAPSAALPPAIGPRAETVTRLPGVAVATRPALAAATIAPGNAPADEVQAVDAAPETSPALATVATPQPPRRIIVPEAWVDAPVRSAAVRNGEWEVPAFAVGHWDGSPTPAETGNGIYYGHVESIRDGQPFATLPRARAGMLVYVDTDELRFVYEITDVEVVSRFATDVLLPSTDTRITLITCTGTFLPAERDYTHRFIATAVLAWTEPLVE